MATSNRTYWVLIGILLLILGGEVFVRSTGEEQIFRGEERKEKNESLRASEVAPALEDKAEPGVLPPSPPSSELVYQAEMIHLFSKNELGKVEVRENNYTGEYEYLLTLHGLKVPEEPAFYEVWFVHKGDIISSQGKLVVSSEGVGAMTFIGYKPNVAEKESLGVTYEKDESNPAPGKLVVEGIFEEVRE